VGAHKHNLSTAEIVRNNFDKCYQVFHLVHCETTPNYKQAHSIVIYFSDADFMNHFQFPQTVLKAFWHAIQMFSLVTVAVPLCSALNSFPVDCDEAFDTLEPNLARCRQRNT
jgi:hypothetical protein